MSVAFRGETLFSEKLPAAFSVMGRLSPDTLLPQSRWGAGVVTLGQGVLGPSPLPVGQRVTAGTPEGNLRKPGEMPAGWREAPGGARGASSCGNQSEETNLSGRLRGCRARTKGPTRAG